MKIQITSDAHIDINLWTHQLIDVFANKHNAQILIIAGDLCEIGYKKKDMFFNKFIKPNFEHIIIIPGNHDYYGTIWRDDHNLNNSIGNVHLLDNRSITIEGVNFIGSTLWTKPLKKQTTAILNTINDYYKIIDFNISRSTNEFLKNKSFIKYELEKSKLPNIVITHHLPSEILLNGFYVDSDISSVYASNIDLESINATHWIHGHSHNSFEKKIKDCMFIRNPFGYSKCGQADNYKTKIINIKET